MKTILTGLYILFTELVYMVAIFFVAYFFVKFFWNKEKVQGSRGKIKIVEKEKPNKRRVTVVYLVLIFVILFVDIICVLMDLNLMVAYRVYPFGMEENSKEGIYTRPFYNIQITFDDQNEQEVLFNFLCLFNTKEIEKTKVRDSIKKGTGTFFTDLKEGKISNEIVENRVENVIENTIIENVVENNVSENKVNNKVENKVNNKINNKVENKTENKVTNKVVNNVKK